MFILADQLPDIDIHYLAEALRKIELEALLLPIIIQLAIILVAARIAALVARLCKQPEAVGEIAAGLLLGPSFFGRLWPEGFAAIFHPRIRDVSVELMPLCDATLHWIFTILSQLGLVFLLFLIGLEFDFSHLRSRSRAALSISLAGIVAPFSLGIALAWWIHPAVNAEGAAFTGFGLFMGTAMSITALPILGRMMMEMNITTTRIGAITISAAAMDDVLGWIILATVAAIVRGQFSTESVVFMISATLAFGLGMIFLAGPLLRRLARFSVTNPARSLSPFSFAMLLCLMLGCGIVTNVIGIFSIFGAFLLGAILSPEHAFRHSVSQKLHDVVMVFFLPIFFTYTGLRTRIETVDSPQMWLICGAVIGVAILGKFAGCGLTAKFAGFSTRESICIGTMMNTRALMELVVINIGRELGVIPDSVFAMLVLMALLTTVMTTPILLWAMKGTELESHILRSSLVASSGAAEKSA